MNKLNVPLIFKTLLVIWIVLTAHSLLFTDGIDEQANLKEFEDVRLETIQEIKKTELSNADTVALFNKIEPDKSAKKEEPKPVVVPKKVIDKTLLPNFQRFDPDHQAGLAAIFGGGRRFAVIQLKNYETQISRYERVELNQKLGDYSLTSINDDFVVFNNNDEQLVLELFTAKNK